MSIPRELPCHLAQDLLIPYAAGDVSPETRQWLEEHVASCADCRALYEATNQSADAVATPSPVPVGDPGRRVLGRMRRNIFLIVGAVIVAIGLGGGALFWGIRLMHNLSGMPAYHPAPIEGIQPVDVVEKLDLSDVGLTKQYAGADLLTVPRLGFEVGSPQQGTLRMNGTVAVTVTGPAPAYLTPGGQATATFIDQNSKPVIVTALRADTAKVAKEAYHAWMSSFHVKMFSVQFDRLDESAVRFRSTGQYWYAWQRGNWWFIIQQSETSVDPAKVRDQVRDRLISTINELNQAKGQ